MAASCMGTFGTYQYMFNRPSFQYSHNFSQGSAADNDTVWVIKRYKPTDLRVTAPVPRHKLMAPAAKDLPAPDQHWVPPTEASPKTFSREREERMVYRSTPSTRCEEWSTLRQMFPSRGRPQRISPPNWGTGFAEPPQNTSGIQRSFPHINSPMTR